MFMNAQETGQRFDADSKLIEKLGGDKIRQIIGLIFGIVAILLFFLFNNLQDNSWYDKSTADLYGILKICCIGIGLLEIILSPIALYDLARVERNLNQTHITLYTDRIEGICFNNPAKDTAGTPFVVRYSDIIGATVVGEPEFRENNLEIKTANRAYYCYAIHNSREAAANINDRVQNWQNPSPAEANTATSSNAVRYCMYCGTQLPTEAVFCCKCGKSN